MDFIFSVELSRLVRDVSSLSVREVSIVSGLSSFASFINDLNTGGNVGTCGRSCLDRLFIKRCNKRCIHILL